MPNPPPNLPEQEIAVLPLAEAIKLSEDELRRRFWQIVVEVADFSGEPDFATYTPRMTRTAMLAAITKHAYWFDPNGGHPVPPLPQT